MSLTGLILHGLETDGKFNPGRAAEIPAGGGAGAATSPFDPTALHHEATVLTGQGKGRCQARLGLALADGRKCLTRPT